MLLTRSPLIHPASWASAFDLHVLSTPPAFVLSQDQTLRTKTKNRHKKTNEHTIEFTNNTHTIKHTRMSRMFSKGVPRHVSATRASRFVHCRSAQQGKQYALLQTSSNQASRSRLPRLFRMISPFSTKQRRQTAPKSAIFMPQTTEISPKCAPANSMFASK